MLALVLALQVAGTTPADTVCTPYEPRDRNSVSIQIGGGEPARPDSAERARTAERRRAVRDSILDEVEAKGGVRCEPRKQQRRVAVTPEHLRTAFTSPAARVMFESARAARANQDSSLLSYDAKSYQRISAHMGFRKIGRQRLVFRTENASRVRWERGTGTHVELLGARTAVPITGRSGSVAAEVRKEIDTEMGDAFASAISPIPYYPGRDQLLPMIDNGVIEMDVDEENLIHPLANGSEAYYVYEVGDSSQIRLPGGRAVRLKELKVRARRPQWNVAVASLWFDADRWQLVRAVYRFSEPLDIKAKVEEEEPGEFDDVPGWIKPAIFPMVANVSALTVEYGLHQQQYWLPRFQLLEGDIRVGFMRISFDLRERFTYASVGTKLDLPPVFASRASADSLYAAIRRDSTLSDSARRAARRALSDSLAEARQASRRQQCEASGTYLTTVRRHESRQPISVRIPCDTAALTHSSELPPSIYDPGEELFGDEQVEALRNEVLSLRRQSGFAPQPWTLEYGLGLTRYNRVEGLSSGIRAEQSLGAGYRVRGEARLGVADLQPNAELRLARSDGRRTLAVGAYRRLASASDWGNPLGFGASVNALLFGRDEGFYYRAAGVELAAIGEGNSIFEYRLFAERHDEAERETTLSVARLLNGVRFDPNIAAREGEVLGTALQLAGSRGADPHGLRLFGGVRAEGATGDWTYGRLAGELTTSHGLGRWLDGALTLGAGSSVGEVPVQRLWFLGGYGTVRGQDPGTQAGDAFWLARAELGAQSIAARPVLFLDLGWAGARDAWRHPGRPASGVGVGASFLDGLIRFDLARGIWPQEQTRADLYVEATF